MKLSEIVEPLGLKPVTEIGDERDITGCYIGDLLSWVMSRAKSGNIWITIMTNVNIVAVAALTDVACVIVCEGAEPDKDALEKAKQQGISLLTSTDTSYDLAAKVNNLKCF